MALTSAEIDEIIQKIKEREDLIVSKEYLQDTLEHMRDNGREHGGVFGPITKQMNQAYLEELSIEALDWFIEICTKIKAAKV